MSVMDMLNPVTSLILKTHTNCSVDANITHVDLSVKDVVQAMSRRHGGNQRHMTHSFASVRDDTMKQHCIVLFLIMVVPDI